jgi:hypothetical protein
MPDLYQKRLFFAGLVVFLAGQIAINTFGATTKDVTPIDFSHWLILVGVALMIPFASSLPRDGWRIVMTPLLLVGIISVIGMCVLDFVFWSLPDGAVRGDVARRLMDTPLLWKPFIAWGPNYVFNTGLALPCLLFVAQSRAGAALVVGGTLVIAAGPAWYNVVGYIALTIGYFLCFGYLQASKPVKS